MNNAASIHGNADLLRWYIYGRRVLLNGFAVPVEAGGVAVAARPSSSLPSPPIPTPRARWR